MTQKIKIFLSIFCFLFSTLSYAEGSYYLVSAYYSPIPGQDFYLHGSYEEEIKMNGEGVNTSSGEPVRIGAVAAPKELAYNTRVHINQTISLRGISVIFEFHGTILDRGGAIHSEAKLPRLDIYMGKGQEGLCRAINFGVQTLYVNLDSSTTPSDTTNFDKISSTCKNPHTQTVPLSGGTRKPFNPFKMSISAGSPAENIIIVQELLTKTGSYNGPTSGAYDDAFIEALFQFQKSKGIVKERSEDGAGVYGPKTRSMLKSLLPADVVTKYTPVNTIVTTTTTTSESSTPISSNTTTTTTGNTTPVVDTEAYEGLKTEDIKKLQAKLKELSYFSYEPDGLVNKRLIDAVYAFQFDQKIVSIATDPGAGYYGPITRTTLEEVYNTLLEKRERILELENKIKEARKLNEEKVATKKEEIAKIVAKIPALKVGQIHSEIRTLQKFLKKAGYLDYKDTAIFGELTKTALKKYQTAKNLTNKSGTLDAETRIAIVADLLSEWKLTETNSQEVTALEKELAELRK